MIYIIVWAVLGFFTLVYGLTQLNVTRFAKMFIFMGLVDVVIAVVLMIQMVYYP